MSYEVELCVDSLEACIAAEKQGANRVELCACLDIDGITPKMDLVQKVRDAIKIDLNVLIRPRGGNFVYNSSEMEQMLSSIEKLKTIGVDGIVCGSLNEDGSVNTQQLEQLIVASQLCSFTFHRAFDVCSNPIEQYKTLGRHKVDLLLSSGQGKTALDGIHLLKTLATEIEGPNIMVGGGVNADNIPAFWEIGIRSFHFSCQTNNSSGSRVFDKEKAERAFARLKELDTNA